MFSDDPITDGLIGIGILILLMGIGAGGVIACLIGERRTKQKDAEKKDTNHER